MRKNLIIGGQEIITNFRERTWMNFKEDIQVWKIYLRQYFWSGSKNILKDKNHNTNFFTYVPEKSEDRSIVFSFFSFKKTEDRSIVFFLFSFFFFLFSSQKSGSCLSIFGLVLTNTSHTEYQSYKSNTCICTTAGPNNIETHILRPPVHL